MVSGLALRLMTSTGLLAVGVVFGVLSAGTAMADPDDSAAESKAGATKSAAATVSSSSATKSSITSAVTAASSTAGSTAASTGSQSSTSSKSGLVPTASSSSRSGKTLTEVVRGLLPKFSDTVKVPVLRVPGTPFNTSPKEPCAGGSVACFGMIDVPLYNVEDAMKALLDPYGEPEPEPPRPGIRGPVVQSPQIEEPVIDVASPGASSGTAGAPAPQPISAPVVVAAPPPMSAPILPAAPVVAPAAPMVPAAPLAPAPALASAPIPAVAPAPVPGAHLLRTPLAVPAAPSGLRPPTSASGLPKPANVQLKGYPTTRPANRVDPRTVAMLEVGVALPGVAGLLLATAGGGVIGYRQANAARHVRTGGAVRYLR